MALYELQKDLLREVGTARLSEHGVRERDHLQRLLKASIDIIVPGAMVIAEEFGDWEDSRRRIDLLCLDPDANLVVVELKRSEDGGHMELQALRYAAMVSGLTFAAAVQAHQAYLRRAGKPDTGAEAAILEFLGWDEPHEDQFGRDLRIVLVSAEFSRELTTTVLWLNERDLDICCVRLRPHALDGRVLLDVQQVIPLPEAADYQVRLREKAAGVREAARERGFWSGYWFVNVGEGRGDTHRCWEDCKDYGYIIAGAGGAFSDQLLHLKAGERFFAYLVGHGYVG